jgi:hypothetical protein
MAAWTGSSRRNPCLVCGRGTDDKCRRREDLISCWYGGTFSPPGGLRVGETLRLADGTDWAVVSLQGGFGNNSLMLAPHKPRGRSSPGHRRTVSHRRRSAPPADPFWATEDTSYRPSNWIVAALYQRHCLLMGWVVPL